MQTPDPAQTRFSPPGHNFFVHSTWKSWVQSSLRTQMPQNLNNLESKDFFEEILSQNSIFSWNSLAASQQCMCQTGALLTHMFLLEEKFTSKLWMFFFYILVKITIVMHLWHYPTLCSRYCFWCFCFSNIPVHLPWCPKSILRLISLRERLKVLQLTWKRTLSVKILWLYCICMYFFGFVPIVFRPFLIVLCIN